MITVKYSTLANEDFQKLNCLLDDDYYQRFGEIALKYRTYNSLKNICNFFTAYAENQPVGCACFKRLTTDTAELKRVFVLPTHRKQGIAFLLVKECEAQAKQQGYKFMVLETGKEMPEAISLYQKAGYQFIDNFGAFAGDSICCCLKKAL
ncbi:MAG: GNAT family N-acetyltransferase [Bacillota bacterium]